MNTTKKIMSAIAAIVLITSVAMVSFAFKAVHKNDVKQTIPYYFQYSGPDTESGYEDSANWSNITSVRPTSNPCTIDGVNLCTLKANFSTTPDAVDLTDYLKSLNISHPDGVSAYAYCHTSSKREYTKP